MRFSDFGKLRGCSLLVCTCVLAQWVWGASTWPTLHNDYQRSGYTEEVVRGPYERKWYRDFHDEMISTRVEAIVAEGKCFVGTLAGNMYALDVKTGRTAWKFEAKGPIGASPCYRSGKLYFGADEGFNTGNLYCVDANSGEQLWHYEAGAGIWTSPACDGRKVYFGDRAGVCHSVWLSDGGMAWRFATDGMILKPASLSVDAKRVIIGSENMHVYCLDAWGVAMWTSPKLHGLSMRDQGPTIWLGLAVVRTSPADSFHTVLDRNGQLLKKIQQSIPMDANDKVLLDKWNDVLMHPTARRRAAEQERIIEYLKTNPYDQTFYAFNLADGTQPWIAPVLYTAGLHNPPTPPTFNPDTGDLYTFCRSALTYYLGGVRRYNALGRLDRVTGRFDFYWPETDDGNQNGLALIGDETQALSLMDDILISTHQGVLAGLNLDSKEVVTFWRGRDTYGGIFGPGAVPGSFEGARELAEQGYLTGMPNEWHGPDRSIVAIAEGRMFWVVGSQVVCLAGPDIPKTDTGGTKSPPAKKSKLPGVVGGGGNVVTGRVAGKGGVPDVRINKGQLAKYLTVEDSNATEQGFGRLADDLRERLDSEVLELVESGPWAPLILQLGISGEERYFWRTSETMRILAESLPHLSKEVRAKAAAFLDGMFEAGMPLEVAAYSSMGKRREPYELGPEMKRYAVQTVRYDAGIEDIYALWTYGHYANAWDKVGGQVDKIAEIYDAFAEKGFAFDPNGKDDNAAHLNAQIAGVLAAGRIFERAGQREKSEGVMALLAEMVSARVRHEIGNKALIRPAQTSSKKMHEAKVPRYMDLVPEAADMLGRYAKEAFARNLKDLTTGLPLWYQAYGERMIGGENWISPPGLSQGLFLATAGGTNASAEQLSAKLDQPLCKADLHYIEKISAILRKMDTVPQPALRF
jgi:outer membrane protein assembly factor BamB